MNVRKTSAPSNASTSAIPRDETHEKWKKNDGKGFLVREPFLYPCMRNRAWDRRGTRLVCPSKDVDHERLGEMEERQGYLPAMFA